MSSDDAVSTAAGGADIVDPDPRGRHTRAEFAVALLLDLVGAAGGCLFALQTWQTITDRAPAPRPNVVVHVSGRTIDAAPLAFALVALAGVVAVLATRGLVRRAVGVIIAAAGIGLVWRVSGAFGAVSTARARTLVTDQHREVSTSGTVPSVAVHPAWPVLSVFCGVLVVLGGALIAARGGRWRAMSAKYESDPVRAADPQRVATSMWTALDRGEDPTASDPAAQRPER